MIHIEVDTQAEIVRIGQRLERLAFQAPGHSPPVHQCGGPQGPKADHQGRGRNLHHRRKHTERPEQGRSKGTDGKAGKY